ncbi:MAG: GNAT family N-acetyltransferase [Methanocella sp.]
MSALPGRPIVDIIEDNTAEFFLGLGRDNGCEACDRPEVKYVFAGCGYNRIMHARFPADRADGIVRQITTRLDTPGIDALWFVTPASAPELPVTLEHYGFTYSRDMKSMALDLSAFSPGPGFPAGVEIREVAGQDDADAWAQVVVASYGFDDDVRRHYGSHLIARNGKADGSRHYYLGLLDGRPVATAVLFRGADAAGIYYVGTLPGARNKGIATAMTQHALREAKARGYRIATLNASAAGQPVYRRLGFVDCFATAIYHRPPRR